MMTHWANSHPGPEKPKFHQYIIALFKSSLRRQVAEAIRIQQRSLVLNSVGVYNRSKLTRLVIDQDWDKLVLDESWEKKSRQDRINLAISEEGASSLEDAPDRSRKSRKKEAPEQENQGNKKRKLEEDGAVWGEQVTPINKARAEFLMGPNNKVVVKNLIQKTITPLTRATLESMIMINDMIALAIKWSDERRELRIAEDALKDEPEWSVDKEPDQGEIMIALKERKRSKRRLPQRRS